MNITLPYRADCLVSGEMQHNLEVLKMNHYSLLVRLPTREPVKRSFRKHRVLLTFMDR